MSEYVPKVGDIVGILVASAFPILALGLVVLLIVTAWRS